ncbi:unnamed protein product [Owenia fusiformis]|uniref:Ionotropic glutamate receptor L-glutamate and glycine-binding domain-containing protein n=1 Tax=Owenia fusiformis TaxID=6347 RepID=A0A8S4PA03_OWEFU|nr:unnamed protein product [Owenia fusiformis]
MASYQFGITVLAFLIKLGDIDGQPSSIRLGALIKSRDTGGIEAAFTYSIFKVNQATGILPRTVLTFDIKYVDIHSTYMDMQQGACAQVSTGVMGIFGPQLGSMSDQVASMCSSLEIPHIETAMNLGSSMTTDFTLNLFPPVQLLSRAYIEYMQYLKWTNVTVVYTQSNTGIHLGILTAASEARLGIRAFHLDEAASDWRGKLREMKESGAYTFFVDLEPVMLISFLKQTQQMGMSDDRYHYIFSDLDSQHVTLDDFKYSGVKISALALYDRNDTATKNISRNMLRYARQNNIEGINRDSEIGTEAMLMYEAVIIFARALHSLDKATEVVEPSGLSCRRRDRTWSHGATMFNYLNIEADTAGKGNLLHILQMARDRRKTLVKAGVWRADAGIEILNDQYEKTDSDTVDTSGVFSGKSDKKIVVYAVLDPPFLSIKPGFSNIGNDRYQGYIPDLLKEIALSTGLNYTLYAASDGKYGHKTRPGDWEGIMGAIINGRADMGGGRLLMTHARYQETDFSHSLMGAHLVMMTSKDGSDVDDHFMDFTLLKPFSLMVWITIPATYVTVSLCLWLINRCDPYERHEAPKYKKVKPDKTTKGLLSIGASFWTIYSTLHLQGFERMPRSIAGRTLTLFWFTFATIVFISYASSLVTILAFGTASFNHPSVQTLEDLLTGNIKFGVIQGSDVAHYLSGSKSLLEQKIASSMEYVSSLDHGISKAKADYTKMGPYHAYGAVTLSVIFGMYPVVAQFDPSVCTAVTPNGGPTLPVLPKTFSTMVECNFINQNKTYDAHEFYDYDANIASVRFVMNEGDKTTLIYKYDTNELLNIKSAEYGICGVSDLATSEYRHLFGIEQNDDGSIHIAQPSRVLRFGADQPEKYMGKTMIRGISCNWWQSCLYLEQIKATINIDWYFSDATVWQMGIGKKEVPIRAKLNGKLTFGDGGPKEFMNEYNFMSFRTEVTHHDAFLVPGGVYCRNQTSTMPNPNVPKHFKTTIETVLEELKFVSYQKEVYDLENNLFRFEYKPTVPPLGKAEMGTDPIEEIHDFNTGTAYLVDTIKGNCSVIPIDQRFPDANIDSISDVDPFGIRIKSAKELFSFDKASFVYQGKTKIREIMCNKWSGERLDFPRPNARAVFEWYFMDEGWSESVGNTFERKEPVMLELWVYDQIALPVGISIPLNYHVDFSFFEFNEHQPSLWEFNIARCYDRLNRKDFEFYFNGNFTTIVGTDVEGFQYAVMSQLVKTAGISPLRVSFVWPSDRNNKIRIHFGILDRTPINGSMAGVSVETSLDDAVALITNKIKSGQFTVTVKRNAVVSNGTTSPAKTYTLSAIASSFKNRRRDESTRTIKITDPGVLAGLGIAMVLVGALLGTAISCLVMRKRGADQMVGSASAAVNKIIMKMKSEDASKS